jgi:hypothetical protein
MKAERFINNGMKNSEQNSRGTEGVVKRGSTSEPSRSSKDIDETACLARGYRVVLQEAESHCGECQLLYEAI